MYEDDPLSLDDPRIVANGYLDRQILEEFGTALALDESHEQWCEMPVRLVYNDAGGLLIEIGPYTLPACSVRTVMDALVSYYPALWPMEAAAESWPNDD